MKHFPEFDGTGFRDCQITAINNLDKSLSENKPRALVQMATGEGKTFTAITAAYRMLKYGKMNRILFLVDTKSLGEQLNVIFQGWLEVPIDVFKNKEYIDLFGEEYAKCKEINAQTEGYPF